MRARIPNSYFLLLNSRYCPYEGDRVGGNGLAAADGVDPLVGFSFDAHARGVDADRLRDGRPHRVNMIANLRRLEDDRHVDVPDLEAVFRRQRDGACEQIQARRVLPARIRVREVPPDVAQARGAEDRVGDRVADDVGVRVPEPPSIERDRHTAEYEPASRHQTMQVVPGAGATGSRGCRSAKAFALRKADAFVLRKADAFALRTADAFALPRAEEIGRAHV